jgi:hypothetical protein
MRAILSIVPILLITTLLFSEEKFTVILKNGKVMKGHFVSENAEMLIFKDAQGLQYSLKKSLLDLEKMKATNTPPQPVPEPIEVKIEETTESTSETTQTNPIEQSEKDQAITTASSDENPYAKSFQRAVSQLETTFQGVKSLLDGMMTAWEVNASTGRNPATALQEFKATKAATITVLADSQLQTLDKLQEGLGNPTSQYVSAVQTFNNAVSELHQYYDSIRQYDGKPSPRVFHSRLTTKEQSIQKKIEDLRDL